MPHVSNYRCSATLRQDGICPKPGPMAHTSRVQKTTGPPMKPCSPVRSRRHFWQAPTRLVLPRAGSGRVCCCPKDCPQFAAGGRSGLVSGMRSAACQRRASRKTRHPESDRSALSSALDLPTSDRHGRGRPGLQVLAQRLSRLRDLVPGTDVVDLKPRNSRRVCQPSDRSAQSALSKAGRYKGAV